MLVFHVLRIYAGENRKTKNVGTWGPQIRKTWKTSTFLAWLSFFESKWMTLSMVHTTLSWASCVPTTVCQWCILFKVIWTSNIYLYINDFYLNSEQEKKGGKQRVKVNKQLYKPISPYGTICYGIKKRRISKVLNLLKPLDINPID